MRRKGYEPKLPKWPNHPTKIVRSLHFAGAKERDQKRKAMNMVGMMIMEMSNARSDAPLACEAPEGVDIFAWVVDGIKVMKAKDLTEDDG